MMPSVEPLGGGKLIAWRLDQARFASTWASGEGAFQVGGRWNSKGVRIVYCALDPATAILEVAVPQGCKQLATPPRVRPPPYTRDAADRQNAAHDNLPATHCVGP